LDCSLKEEGLWLVDKVLFGLVRTGEDVIILGLVGNPGVLDIKEGGWSGVDAELKISLFGVNLNIGNVDSEDGWDLESSGELGVKGSNLGGDESLELSLEGSGVHAKGSLEVAEGSDRRLRHLSEDSTVLRVEDGSN